MSRKPDDGKKQLKTSVSKLIVEWLDEIGTHFDVPLGEDQIKIFLHALKDNTPFQINTAFKRCLNELQFPPKLADVHRFMPEEKYDTSGAWKPIYYYPPILDLVRAVAREICPEITGREYDELDAFKDARLIFKVCWLANRLRYQRMGCDMNTWPEISEKEFDRFVRA